MNRRAIVKSLSGLAAFAEFVRAQDQSAQKRAERAASKGGLNTGEYTSGIMQTLRRHAGKYCTEHRHTQGGANHPRGVPETRCHAGALPRRTRNRDRHNRAAVQSKACPDNRATQFNVHQ